MLSLRDVHASYGPVLALRGVSLDAADGDIITVLGANGAGKTSTLRAVSGMLRPSHGVIEYEGERIDRYPPERIVQMGVSHVPEGRQTFTELTVMENLRLGAYTRKDRRAVRSDLDRVFGYFPVLADRQKQPAGLLSGGEQQMLAIGRALMARPRLLLLDEPSLGLAPLLVREIFDIIRTINAEEKIAIMLVEQNANLSLELAAHGYVLEMGSIAAEGTADSLRSDESVRRAYLGY